MKKLILTLAVAATTFIVSCGGGASDPTAPAKSYLEAQKKGDYATAKKYCTEETKAYLDLIASLGANVPDSIKAEETKATLKVGKANIEGDKASVSYTISTKPGDQTLNLVKQDGKWLVAQSKDPGAEAPGTPVDSVGALKEEAMPAKK